MLITNIEQVRAVVGSAVRKEAHFELFKPYVLKAQTGLITDLIGKEQLLELQATPSSELRSLVEKTIIWNAFQDAWYHAFYQISSFTINRAEPKETSNLFRYQEDGIQKDIVRKADESTESLMLFLEKNIDQYPIYKASDEFKENFRTLISSPSALQRALPEVSKSYRMYSVLRGYMDRVENATVAVVAGPLFDILKQKIEQGSGMDAQYAKLLRLCQDYVAPAVLLESMPWIRVQFSPGGVRILSVLNNLQDETPIKDDQTAWLMDILHTRIETTKTALKMYLNDVASESIFPEYFESDLYRKPGTKKWVMPNNAGRNHFRM